MNDRKVTFADRVKELRKEMGLSGEDLGEKVGITKTGISYWESGKTTPNDSMLITLSELFGVTVDYLLGITNNKSGIYSVTVMTHSVPVYGRIPAGTPFEAIQDLLEDVSIPDWLAKKNDLFGLLVVGDSMNKIVPDGAIAVLQKTAELNNGEIGAVLVNGFDATLKKFFRLTDNVVLEPLSYNPDHKAIVIENNSIDVKVIGKLLWFCAAGEIK